MTTLDIPQKKEELLILAESVVHAKSAPEVSRNILLAMIERLWNLPEGHSEESLITPKELETLVDVLKISVQDADQEIADLEAEHQLLSSKIATLSKDILHLKETIEKANRDENSDALEKDAQLSREKADQIRSRIL